jgi:hypothetical protein
VKEVRVESGIELLDGCEKMPLDPQARMWELFHLLGTEKHPGVLGRPHTSVEGRKIKVVQARLQQGFTEADLFYVQNDIADITGEFSDILFPETRQHKQPWAQASPAREGLSPGGEGEFNAYKPTTRPPVPQGCGFEAHDRTIVRIDAPPCVPDAYNRDLQRSAAEKEPTRRPRAPSPDSEGVSSGTNEFCARNGGGGGLWRASSDSEGELSGSWASGEHERDAVEWESSTDEDDVFRDVIERREKKERDHQLRGNRASEELLGCYIKQCFTAHYATLWA